MWRKVKKVTWGKLDPISKALNFKYMTMGVILKKLRLIINKSGNSLEPLSMIRISLEQKELHK